MDLVLEDDGKTEIYIAGEKFSTCKYVLMNLPANTAGDSMNEIIKNAPLGSFVSEDQIGSSLISPDEAFFVHCSNMQAWVDHDYDIRVLDYRLSFPILKELARLGDVKAKRVFETEIVDRIYTDDIDRIILLHQEDLLDELTGNEKERYCNHLKKLLYRTLPTKESPLPGRKKTLIINDISVILHVLSKLYGYDQSFHGDIYEGASPTKILFDTSRNVLYLGFETGYVVAIDWNTNEVIAIYENIRDKYFFPILELALSPDGTHLATANSCGDVVMYNMGSTGIEVVIENKSDLFDYHNMEYIGKLAFSRDGKYLFSLIIANHFKKIDIQTGIITSKIPPYGLLCPEIYTVVSDDNKFLFKNGYNSDSFLAWDVGTGNHLFLLRAEWSSHKSHTVDFSHTRTLDGTKSVILQEKEVVFKDNVTGESFTMLRVKDDKDDDVVVEGRGYSRASRDGNGPVENHEPMQLERELNEFYYYEDHVRTRSYKSRLENLMFGFSPDG
nr:WD40 repeat domain-containing protein [Candidatus Sigynarchaeota archaeon]